jgi:hypothetical protein
MESVQMRNKILGLVAAAALLASVGGAYAKGPVTLTDGQLDKATAGDVAFLLAVSTAELNNLLALSNFFLRFLNPLSTIPPTNPAI